MLCGIHVKAGLHGQKMENEAINEVMNSEIEGEDKKSILVVDDEPLNTYMLHEILSPEYTVYAAKNGREAIETAKDNIPDIILLDIVMPGMGGYEVMQTLKSIHKTKNIPVIIITGLDNPDDEKKALGLGAADYISKPFNADIVRLRVQNQFRMLELIKEMCSIDKLTGLANRRGFDSRFEIEWGHSAREKKPLSMLMIDIDDFKKYNDKYGHLQGDLALSAVAKAIEGALSRATDFASRWGGEEFVVLLPNTDINGAYDVGERIRGGVEAATVPSLNKAEGDSKVTVSVGVNTIADNYGKNDINEFIERADNALYKSKQSGKNIVSIYGAASSETETITV